MGRQLYPILISTEPPSYTMRYRDTTPPQKTVRYSNPGNEPVDCKTFCTLIDDNRSALTARPTELTVPSRNLKEVDRHAG
jgi:hypothetical protein